MKIKKGELLTFASGEYSDYCVNALVVTLKEFDIEAEKKEWQSSNTNPCKHNPSEMVVTGVEFLPWLCIKGLAEDRDYHEVHTGSYGESDMTFYSKGAT